MLSKRFVESFFTSHLQSYVPHLTVNCVVFGFHDSSLKLLLSKWKHLNVWALPGGFVGRRQSVDDAARRTLRDRTGLQHIHLRQFHAFGGLNRREQSMRKHFATVGVRVPRDAWPTQRIVSIGYYALVDFTKVQPKPDYMSDACSWFPIRDRPPLAFDHDEVVAFALAALRARLDSPTACASLMPESFSMPELQRLHEAILGKPLDRRNFQKRMLDLAVLERLPQRRTDAARRAPFLYRFRAAPGLCR
jgi:8-oxo-dGTP diphosphatase